MTDITRIIVFDTETTGLSPEKHEIVQLSYILYNVKTQAVEFATKQGDDIVSINAPFISKTTSDVHGITKEATIGKEPIKHHIDQFIGFFDQADMYVGHNVAFDRRMIIGQINKYYSKLEGEEKDKYGAFLAKFRDPKGKNSSKSQIDESVSIIAESSTPLPSYCTMNESKGRCAELARDGSTRKRKLLEVHKLLFNQEPKGQLHNALVDISVTLRVFLKLTDDVDICQSITKMDNVVNIQNNNDICNLINPEQIVEADIEPVEYTGELITGFTVLPDDEIKEEKIMVESIYKKLAKKVVSDASESAMKSVISRYVSVAPIDETVMCTDITVCTTIIKSGKRKNEICNRPARFQGFCNYHKPKILPSSKILPSAKVVPIDETISLTEEPNTSETEKLDKPLSIPIKIKADTKSTAESYVSNLFGSLSKSRKIVPVSGGKRKTRKNKKTHKKRQNKKNVRFSRSISF